MQLWLKANFAALLLILILAGCRSDSQENPRAFVEGRLISATVDYNKFVLHIVSENAVMAKTLLDATGKFKLSGPVSESGFSLVSPEKIKSFETDKVGLKLSADSLQIDVPPGITYVKFNEIVLEK